MTFDEAVKLKQSIGNTIIEDGRTMKVFVVPAKQDDFDRYRGIYKSSITNRTDRLSQKYSSDNSYEVYALSTDGAGVIYKKLS